MLWGGVVLDQVKMGLGWAYVRVRGTSSRSTYCSLHLYGRCFSVSNIFSSFTIYLTQAVGIDTLRIIL